MRKIVIPGFMLTLIALLFLAASAAPQTPAPAPSATQDTCVSCHQDTGGKMAAPIKLVSEDIHGQQGFSCDSCHGGDSSQADKSRSMDPRKGFVGKPSPRDVSRFCGKCHDNENSQYSASVHGKQTATGDAKPATCVSCHGAHGVYEVKDARSPVHPTHVSDTCGKCHSDAESMKPYGIPTDQAAKYRTSVHADALFKRNDLSAPTCNDCHGNHSIAPAKAGMAAGACATCHVRHAELFSKSPHKDGFEALGLPSCVTCHGNHAVLKPTDAAVGIDKGTTCRMCHDQGEPGYTAAETIHRTLTSLDKNIVESGLLLDRAARVGMEVSGARFDLNGARDSLLNARVIMHTSSADEVGKTAAVGLALADKAHASGEAALKEHEYRRKGLGIALFVIGLAVVSVYLKIRQIEAPSSNTEDQ